MKEIQCRLYDGKFQINETLRKTFFEHNNGAWVTIKVHSGTRTSQQNRSLHLDFQHMAEALNSAGFTVQLVLKEKMDLDWTGEMVKELLWRPAQKAILKKKSTTELGKQEDIEKVRDHLLRHLAEKFGVELPDFPSHAPGYADTAPLRDK